MNKPKITFGSIKLNVAKPKDDEEPVISGKINMILSINFFNRHFLQDLEFSIRQLHRTAMLREQLKKYRMISSQRTWRK
jgi:hypothetical protein